MRRLRIPLLVMLALWLAIPGPAVGQAPQGLESLTPEERARVQENLERWKQLSPDERQRVRENYERWKQLSPEERQRARQNLETFRRLSTRFAAASTASLVISTKSAISLTCARSYADQSVFFGGRLS